jgi:hypothetical protein
MVVILWDRQMADSIKPKEVEKSGLVGVTNGDMISDVKK